MSKRNTDPMQWMKDLASLMDNIDCRQAGETISVEQAYTAMGRYFKKAKENDTHVWWIGNGGSAAVCSHLSQDMLNKLGIKSLCLSDASLLTCMANDFGYANVYKKPLETLCSRGHVLIAISSSGNSDNIIQAVEFAKKAGMIVISLSGFNCANRLWRLETELAFHLPSESYGIVEIGHEMILHAVIECLWAEQNGQ